MQAKRDIHGNGNAFFFFFCVNYAITYVLGIVVK